MKKYFDVHVFYSRKDGFSIPVEMDIDENGEDSHGYFEDDVIEFAVNNKLLDLEDSEHVDSVDEIEFDEYKQMKGI
ncbi:MAG: hypothetical protein ABFD07_03515 [Methanobacterium sp.]